MFKIRIRAIVGVMIFIGNFWISVVRNNLSVHIVSMAQVSVREEFNNAQFSSTNGTIKLFLGTRGGIADLITWDNMRMGELFSAYHIGYCVCLPIFHNLGDRLGPTWVVSIAGVVSGVLSCLTPAAAYVNFWLVFSVRVLEGFCAGAMQPSMVQILRNWVPPTERNHFMWAYCGFTMGTFSAFLLCAATHYYSGWAVGFYLTGSLQTLWSIMWILFVTDYPRNHSCISDEEMFYLSSAIGTVFTIKLTNSQTPWSLILRSKPFWALCILNFGYSWMIISLCIYGPLYYTRVAKYSIYNAAAITAIPFFFRLVLGIITIQTLHYCKRRPNVRQGRKYFIIVSHVLPGLILAITWFFPIIPGPILLSVAVSLTAAGMDLTLDLCHELTPTFMTSVNTVIKMIGNTSGIIISLSVGDITQKSNLPIVWKHIWCFHATVLFVSGIIYLIWGETHVQPWNFKRNQRPRREIVKPSSTMSDILEVDEEKISTSMMTQTSNLLQS